MADQSKSEHIVTRLAPDLSILCMEKPCHACAWMPGGVAEREGGRRSTAATITRLVCVSKLNNPTVCGQQFGFPRTSGFLGKVCKFGWLILGKYSGTSPVIQHEKQECSVSQI